MLYEFLSPYQGAMNLFSFITFRVALALATGLILTMLFGAIAGGIEAEAARGITLGDSDLRHLVEGIGHPQLVIEGVAQGEALTKKGGSTRNLLL